MRVSNKSERSNFLPVKSLSHSREVYIYILKDGYNNSSDNRWRFDWSSKSNSSRLFIYSIILIVIIPMWIVKLMNLLGNYPAFRRMCQVANYSQMPYSNLTIVEQLLRHFLFIAFVFFCFLFLSITCIYYIGKLEIH